MVNDNKPGNLHLLSHNDIVRLQDSQEKLSMDNFVKQLSANVNNQSFRMRAKQMSGIKIKQKNENL